MDNAGKRLRDAIALQRSGNASQAETIYRQVICEYPGNADALHLAGVLCSRTGRMEEAQSLLLRAIEADPSVPQFHNNLGSLLGRMKRPAEAVERLREAIRLRLDYAEAHLNLGIALQELGQTEQAEGAFRRAVELRPNWALARRRLGMLLRQQGRGEEAETALVAAVAAGPDDVENYRQLAALLGGQGRLDEAITCYREASIRNPGAAAPHSDLLHLLHYRPSSTREELFAEAKRWARQHADSLDRNESPRTREVDGGPSGGLRRAQSSRRETGDVTPALSDRKIRIGYVSADFREHPVARLMLPVLRFLDRDRFETICYSDVEKSDGITQQFQRLAGAWRETAELSDAGLTNVIRDDRIDILVDLAGHMGGNRLLAFARKPAPIQVTHFNYPDTTGMEAMDWRIVDERSSPLELGEDAFNSEKLLRLPDCAWCYDPGERAPAVAPTPALANGHVTFGCLNKLLKVTEPAIALWSRILDRIPNARLTLLSPDRENRHMRGLFAKQGIDAGRLIFVAPRPRVQYLELFGQIDIALDPFPYNGGVTTCDGLWMGVPHITLEGDRHASRQGVMLLTNIGLGELIAKDMDQYVEIASALATDIERLATLRRGIRERLAQSPICDGKAYAVNLAAAYRRMWNERVEDNV